MQVALFGHTHVPMMEYAGGVYLMNPGSLEFHQVSAGKGSYGVAGNFPLGDCALDCPRVARNPVGFLDSPGIPWYAYPIGKPAGTSGCSPQCSGAAKSQMERWGNPMNTEYERWLAQDLEDPDSGRGAAFHCRGMRRKSRIGFIRIWNSVPGACGGSWERAQTASISIPYAKRPRAWPITSTGRGPDAHVAIGYDSRIKSETFAKTAAEVLAANGITAHIYPQLMPTPALSYAVRYLKCRAGINITASHNPAKYNGYKAYDASGSQVALEVADAHFARNQPPGYFCGCAAYALRRGGAGRQNPDYPPTGAGGVPAGCAGAEVSSTARDRA